MTHDSWLRSHGYAVAAFLVCLCLGLAMIANNQLGGETMWFYYAIVFHKGVKLYADLHVPLQPLFILENVLRMKLLGNSNIAVEIPSIFHVLLLAGACYLLASESPWRPAQKALMMVTGFMLVVYGSSYRFDDYHIISESMILYSIWMMVLISRTDDDRTRLWRVVLLGLFTGLTFTTRNTDGAALGVSASFAMLFVMPRSRVLAIALYTAVTVAVIVFIVKLTGESISTYLSMTLFRAAKSKGGTGSIASAPIHMFLNSFPPLVRAMKSLVGSLVVMTASGWAVLRWWPSLRPFLVPLEVLLFVILTRVTHVPVVALRGGMFVSATVLVASVLLYVLPPVVLAHGAWETRLRRPWDHREILLVIPLAEWASYSASSAGQPLLDYYSPIAEFMLVVAVLAPFRRLDSWARPAFMAWMLLICASTVSAKAEAPYSWQNYAFPPMFQGRVWYRHPVRGEMYIDRELLDFSTRICEDIGETGFKQGQLPNPRPELLSLPYSFPNYFCDTPPWRNYVQTWFDISTQQMIDQLINQLQTDPPQFIVYQRQLNIMDGVEHLYNHDRPIPHRLLDRFIMDKIRSGQWQVVDTSDYLAKNARSIDVTHDPDGERWFIIRTHP